MPRSRSTSSRIAFELNDVVAHGLSAIAVQAEAAQAALSRDPSSAACALETIRLAAREALDDVRRLLAITQEEGDGCGRMPQPGIGEIEALVRRARAGDQPVTFVGEGEPRPIPASLGLAAYRVVQEALANACERADGRPVTVRVAWLPGTLEVSVTDAGAAGRRAAAMRERVRLHGGVLRAGPGRRGGYRVVASFPV